MSDIWARVPMICLRQLFEATAASTGLSEKAAREAGFKVGVCEVVRGHHAGYYPGAQPVTLKLVRHKLHNDCLQPNQAWRSSKLLVFCMRPAHMMAGVREGDRSAARSPGLRACGRGQAYRRAGHGAARQHDAARPRRGEHAWTRPSQSMGRWGRETRAPVRAV